MSEAALLLIIFVIALVVPLALWASIREETANPEITDRETAERITKERGGIDGSDSPTRSSPSPDRASDRQDRLSEDGRSTGTETEYSVFDDDRDRREDERRDPDRR
ncbi:hypothetical protein ACFQGT_16415 [Natrialbaceae archaeon GCM10025810]|uniref:hypothetical protein n=1 Tax=Halovalidus salilacus TaxID=3075124 RepID=UPI003606C24F